MAKMKFTLDAWLKDKSQEVETRDGRIVHNIWCIKEPFYTNNKKAEVCALIDGEEDALVFFDGGRYLPTTQDTDSPFDLFIITPDQELSEWEKAAIDYKYGGHDSRFFDEGYLDEAKQEAAALLEIAKEEIAEQSPSIIEVQSFNAGRRQGREEALKDLPGWKKLPDGIMNQVRLMDKAIIVNHHYILFTDLEKLPGLKED